MRVLVDACVLYPTLLRNIVLGVARTGAFTPFWSARIIEEWRRAALRTHPEQAAALAGEIALTGVAWPEALVDVPPDAEAALSLPDENDRHVLAAAIATDADLILTLNLRDFPGRTLARYGVRVEHPDPFLLALYREGGAPVAAAVTAQTDAAAAAIDPVPDQRALLKKSRLPRLAKAIAGRGAGI
ncbi:MAG: PIN domain-containing protein [Rhodobacteraceae bacterium]|nr:PIN domain-containing protein [Paracoccaceae bacterium]